MPAPDKVVRNKKHAIEFTARIIQDYSYLHQTKNRGMIFQE
jgi:hypothetical protein